MINRIKLKELKQLMKDKGFTFEKSEDSELCYGILKKNSEKLDFCISISLTPDYCSETLPESSFPYIFDVFKPLVALTVWSSKEYIEDELISFLIKCLTKFNYNWSVN